MPGTTSSSSSRISRARKAGARKHGGSGAFTVTAALAALSAGAIWFFLSRGQLLWYGDAAAHVNIARRVVDSRTPGWPQIGTVWLPLPHVLMLPFVGNDKLWATGLAGAIPSGICFVLAGLMLFLAARRVFGTGEAGAAAALLIALNPNVLYLQAIPMTEAVFLACLAGVLYCSVRFRDEQSWGSVIGAGLFCCAGALTRYEGWFLIPFVAAFFAFAAKRRRVATAGVFSALAALGPLYWLFHNQYFYGNALDFYNGGSSAKAIYQRALDRGMARYPGDHEWGVAAKYVASAVRLCAGWPLVWLAAAGALAVIVRRKAVWPLMFLALAPAFYVLSLHSGGTPIFIPTTWPFSYYNSRYAIAAMPLLAFAGAGLVALAPERFRKFALAGVVLIGISPWVGYPRPDNWVCWKESQVNSEARRAWTREAADFFRANYRRGDGILTPFGDTTAIYQQAGIPLRETLTECSNEIWRDTLRGALPLREKWAVAIAGDTVAQTLDRLRKTGPRYDLVKTIAVKTAPVIQIFRRHE